MVQGRRKGNSAEIEVAKLLTKWWSAIEPDVKFKRTPLSGGWGDQDTRGGFKVAGDICTTSSRWPFTVEVKRREGWTFGVFSAGRPSPVWAWWRQCIDQAAEEDRIPMLWMRKNRMPWMILLPETQIVPILERHLMIPDLILLELSTKIDDGDIRPAMVFAEKFLSISPKNWLPSRCRSR